MSKRKNDWFIVIAFSLLWAVNPISYNEMRNRNKIYEQEIQTNISNKQQNTSFNEILSKQNSTNLNEVILVKNNGLLPGADSFSPSFPEPDRGTRTKISGGCSPSSNPTPKFPYQLSPNHQKNKNKKKNSREVSNQRVIEAYQNFISEMNCNGYQTDNISEDRFFELSTNPETGQLDEKSIYETEGGLQGELEGLYNDLRRPKNRKVGLDFEATSVETGKRIFVDHKGMIDFASLVEKGIDISNFPTH